MPSKFYKDPLKVFRYIDDAAKPCEACKERKSSVMFLDRALCRHCAKAIEENLTRFLNEPHA